MPDARILVAEEDPAIRSAVSWLLKEQGYEVAAVTRGADLIDQIERR